jgi:hypothetical protein
MTNEQLKTLVIGDSQYDLSLQSPMREGYEAARQGTSFRANPYCEQHSEEERDEWENGHTHFFDEESKAIIEAAING